MYQIFTAVAGGIVGGVLGGVTQYNAAKKKAKAMKKAANIVKEANEKYSGENAYNTMRTASQNSINDMLKFANSGNTDTRLSSTGFAGANQASSQAANQSASLVSQGSDLGAGIQDTMNKANLKKAETQAQNVLNQANVDANVATAGAQGIQQGVAGVADLVKNIRSDERCKELPESSVEDSLRKIDNIQYKYKDDTGLDTEDHVGVTAQSVEDTDMKDMVKEDDSGYKMLDKQMMLEAVLAGCAALQKEIDELESKVPSDKDLKEEPGFRLIKKRGDDASGETNDWPNNPRKFHSDGMLKTDYRR